jgi:hypothetical protein
MARRVRWRLDCRETVIPFLDPFLRGLDLKRSRLTDANGKPIFDAVREDWLWDKVAVYSSRT